MKTIALSSIALLLWGCAAAVVGVAAGATGGYLFVNGQLRDTLRSPLPDVQKASTHACRTLGFHLKSSRVDRLKGKISAEMADGTKVFIWLKARDFKTTRIAIRVGAMGDRSLSVQILKVIKKRL